MRKLCIRLQPISADIITLYSFPIHFTLMAICLSVSFTANHSLNGVCGCNESGLFDCWILQITGGFTPLHLQCGQKYRQYGNKYVWGYDKVTAKKTPTVLLKLTVVLPLWRPFRESKAELPGHRVHVQHTQQSVWRQKYPEVQPGLFWTGGWIPRPRKMRKPATLHNWDPSAPALGADGRKSGVLSNPLLPDLCKCT